MPERKVRIGKGKLEYETVHEGETYSYVMYRVILKSVLITVMHMEV
jgi:hypothetical protein